MRRYHFLLILAFFILSNNQSFATHILGGEMNYRCLGNNQYEVRMVIYRDCLTGIPWFDDPASIGIFNAQTNAFISQRLVSSNDVSNDTLSLNIPDTCYTGCIHSKIYYIDTVTLTPNSSGYILAYQRCCRSQAVNNLVDPSNSGMTISIEINPLAMSVCNSSPRFINEIPVALPVHVPFSIDLSALDFDGDSLAYILYNPFDGASAANPMPQPPNGPPFLPVSFNSGFSSITPITSNPSINYDPITGIFSGTPTALGTYVIGFSILEYNESGILISQSYKDFSITITGCLTNLTEIPSSLELSIFPNPSSDIFTIQCNEQTNITMQIFNQYGSKISEQNFVNQIDINLSEQPTGIYFVELTLDKKRVVKKIIKL